MKVHTVTVESFNRDVERFPDPAKYVVYLPNVIHNVHRVELVNCKVPNTVMNLTDGTNCLELSDTTGRVIIFSIADGFYTPELLLEEFNRSIKNLTKISMRYRSGQGKFQLYRKVNLNTPFIVRINSPALANLLGFDVGQTYTSAQISVPNSTTFNNVTEVLPLGAYHDDYGVLSGSSYVSHQQVWSPHLCSFDKFGYVYLDIDEFRNPLVTTGLRSATNGVVGQSQFTFAPILLEEGSFGIKYFHEETDSTVGINLDPKIDKLSKISVNWRGSDGNLVDFAGVDFNAFQLRIHSSGLVD